MGTLNSSTMVDTRTPGQADKYPEVLFYYANLLDYLRLVFLYWACCTDGVVYSTLQPLFGSDGMYFGVMYTISMGLDAFDGMLARAYDQCSKFGYYADMIIDRISSITALLYAAFVFCSSKYWPMVWCATSRSTWECTRNCLVISLQLCASIWTTESSFP